VQVITDYAKNNAMDLIVMGSRGQSKFKKMIVGSVADGVVTHSGLPVLITR
jgi:nucleotide-binding universal stress UspA family protein